MGTFENMKNFIKQSYKARKYIVPCLVGPTGIGKTAAVKQAAVELKDEGLASGKVVTIIASQILPNEVSGITMPVVEERSMEIFDHFRLSSLKDGDIVFFDELLEADQMVLSACLTLIESRELMSGRPLPDVMIVGATNPTIQPSMLKENIRQRFVWREFRIDVVDCGNYILSQYGFHPGNELLQKLTDTGDEYNILTPRSLTKMAGWMSQAKDEAEAKVIAGEIDCCWHMGIGSKLMRAFLGSLYTDTQVQVRRAVRIALSESGVTMDEIDDVSEGMGAIMYDDDAFSNVSMTELMDILKKLPEWHLISDRLSKTEIKEADDIDKISF